MVVLVAFIQYTQYGLVTLADLANNTSSCATIHTGGSTTSVILSGFGYSPPLTNLAAQTEFSQPQKDCSGSSKDAHGL